MNQVGSRESPPAEKMTGLYKKRYQIVFYDDHDEEYLYGFNTVLEICRFKKLEVTTNNINQLHVDLYRALRRKEPTTRMLTGEMMYVHLIDMLDDN